MGKRRLAREMAVQMLYQADVAASAEPTIVGNFDVSDFLLERSSAEAAEAAAGESDPGRGRTRPAAGLDEARAAFDHARQLFEGTRSRLPEIDELIRAQAENWRLERMPPVDRNILRLAVFELLRELDVPRLVVVDEAVELAKRFGSDQSGKFVNGLLDGMLKRGVFPPDFG